MVSHAKFLKTWQKEDAGLDKNGRQRVTDVTVLKYVFYVKDGQYIMRLNLEDSSLKQIGDAGDSIIALSVSRNQLREKDEPEKYPYNYEGTEHKFQLICLNENQQICIFSSIDGVNIDKKVIDVTDAKGLSIDLKKKDLFGMGYPYFISMYGKYVAATSDYGVLLFELN